MILFVFLVFLAIFLGGSESSLLECEFIDHSEAGYYCNVKNNEFITSRDNQEITEVRGQHLDGKTHDDVFTFVALNKKVDFFPRGLTNYFKNIKHIVIAKTNLQEITIDDLKEFSDKLESFSCVQNKITFIEKNAFNGLEKLETLYLEDNPCTAMYNRAHRERFRVLELISKVEESCKIPDTTTSTTTLKPITENPIIAAFKEQMLALTLNLTESLKNLIEKHEEIVNLKIESLKLSEENKKCN